MTKQNTFTGIALAVIATLLWSGNFIIARGVFQKIPPVHLAFYRWAAAILILLPFALKYFLREWPVLKQHVLFFFVASLTGITLFNTLIYIGAHYTSAINLALIGTTTTPVFAIILARIFLGEQIGFLKTIGMIVCAAGIIYLLSRGKADNLFHLQFSEGDLWALMAALSFSIYNTMVKKKPEGISGVNFLFSTFTIGALLLLPFFVWEASVKEPVKWNGNLALIILYIGLGASVFSFLAWNKAIYQLGAGRTALFGNLIPIFSSIGAVLFLPGEKFSMLHLISTLLVFAGLLIANLQLFRPKKE